MKAIIYREYGDANVLRIEERNRPLCGHDEILVKVRAVEATKTDTELRGFRFPVKWYALPLRLFWGIRKPRRQILGGYFSGEVAQVGAQVARFSVGDEIFGTTSMRMGAYGEYMALSATGVLTKKARNMNFEEAAAVPLGGLNALHFMRLAKIQPGEQVLINGAGGSIGLFATQIATAMGARVVGVDAPHKRAVILSAGAAEFIEYTQRDFTAESRSYDVIFDMVASSSISRCLARLKSDGRYLTGNPTLGKMLHCSWTNCFSNKKAMFAFAGEKQEELECLRDMIEAGQIRSTIDQVLPLERAAEAHRRVESEQREGIVVLTL